MNGGPFQTRKRGRVPGCDDVWINEESMTNIFSLARLTDKFRVTMDSAVENAFLVHTPFGIIKFKRSLEDVYARMPEHQIERRSPSYGEQKVPRKVHFPQTVADNERFYLQSKYQERRQLAIYCMQWDVHPLLISNLSSR